MKRAVLLCSALFSMSFCAIAAQEEAHHLWNSVEVETDTEHFFRAYTEERGNHHTFLSFDLMSEWCDHFEMSINVQDPITAKRAYNDDIFLGDLQIDYHKPQTMTFQLSIDPEYTLLHFSPMAWNGGGAFLEELLQGDILAVHLNNQAMFFSLKEAKEALTRIVRLCVKEKPTDVSEEPYF